MNTMIALPIAAAIPTDAPAMPAEDAELVSLTNRLFELLPAYQSAFTHEQNLWKQFDGTKPKMSDVLLFRIDDPVGYTWEDDPLTGKRRCWTNPFDIAVWRDVPQCRWEFIGTAEERDTITGDETQFDGRIPRPHIAHLYRQVPDARLQRRLNQLAAALDEHTAAVDALKAELGVHEAKERAEALYGPISEIVERIEQLPARTLAGLRAKAAVLYHWNWEGRDPDDLDTEERLVTDIVEGLLGQQQIAA